MNLKDFKSLIVPIEISLNSSVYIFPTHQGFLLKITLQYPIELLD